MKYGSLTIETSEYEKLIEIIGMAKHRRDDTYHASIDKLLEELKSAKKLPIHKMPDDVVRFNSTVEISFPNGNKRSLQVVLPNHSDVGRNKISILAPMSLALFGYAENDEISWQFPAGLQSIRILKVSQLMPEVKQS